MRKNSMAKRALSIVLALMMMLSVCVTTITAQDAYTEADGGTIVSLLVGYPNAIVGDKKVQIDSANPDVVPVVIDDRTLVPVRFISESFGATVAWDSDSKTITVVLAETTIQMVLDSKDYTINSQPMTMDVPAQVMNDRTIIPLRAMVEGLGKYVFWDSRGLIVISDVENVYTTGKDEEKIAQLVESLKDDSPISNPVSIPTPPPTQTPDPNAEIEKLTVSASAFETASHGIYLPELTIDGSLDGASSWRAEGDSQWIMYDLGIKKDVKSIEIAFFKGNERKYTFDLLVSVDGNDWNTIKAKVTNSGTSDQLEKYDITQKGIRYIKLVGHGNNSEAAPDWINIVEVKIN